jgi:multidrug efflux pump subunit AcrA (membrane-fusion protein)
MDRITRAGLIAVALSVLAACGGGGDPPPPAPPAAPVVVAKQEDQFGANFASAFRASPTSEPITPVDGDIIALSLTAEPVPLG